MASPGNLHCASCIGALSSPEWGVLVTVGEGTAHQIMSGTQMQVIAASLSAKVRRYHTHTHTCLTALFLGLPRWAGTRKVKPIWILLKQETVSASGISWVICKSAPSSIQITMPAPHHSVFYRPDALPAAQPTASKHWSIDFGHFCLSKQHTDDTSLLTLYDFLLVFYSETEGGSVADLLACWTQVQKGLGSNRSRGAFG